MVYLDLSLSLVVYEFNKGAKSEARFVVAGGRDNHSQRWRYICGLHITSRPYTAIVMLSSGGDLAVAGPKNIPCSWPP